MNISYNQSPQFSPLEDLFSDGREGGEVRVGGDRTQGAVIVQEESEAARQGTNISPQAGVEVLQLERLHLSR